MEVSYEAKVSWYFFSVSSRGKLPAEHEFTLCLTDSDKQRHNPALICFTLLIWSPVLQHFHLIETSKIETLVVFARFIYGCYLAWVFEFQMAKMYADFHKIWENAGIADRYVALFNIMSIICVQSRTGSKNSLLLLCYRVDECKKITNEHGCNNSLLECNNFDS